MTKDEHTLSVWSIVWCRAHYLIPHTKADEEINKNSLFLRIYYPSGPSGSYDGVMKISCSSFSPNSGLKVTTRSGGNSYEKSDTLIR